MSNKSTTDVYFNHQKSDYRCLNDSILNSAPEVRCQHDSIDRICSAPRLAGLLVRFWKMLARAATIVITLGRPVGICLFSPITNPRPKTETRNGSGGLKVRM